MSTKQDDVLDAILDMLNAKIVMQVCGNFALKDEFGELTKEVNDSRAAQHREYIEAAKAAILSQYIAKADVLRALGEDERALESGDLWVEIRNELRQEIRTKLGLGESE